ncbi:MAG: flavin reductase family protein [Lachnospiraceae bacterium]|nr:flavin reductase family protein [Lachnospiraceae bacterium]
MSKFMEIEADTFDVSPFRMIGKEWMLIAAEKEEKVNALTASWGGLGFMWNRNAAYIFVRESRYTKEFIDESSTFSLNFFDHKKHAKMLSYMGTVSGRNEDKIAKAELTVNHAEGVPYFEEASVVMVCKKMCSQPVRPENFNMEEIDRMYYGDKDYHTMYIGEVVSILKKED